MPPPEKATGHEASTRALALWERLSELYDSIEEALHGAAPADTDLAGLGRAIVETEAELRPLVAEVGVRRNAAEPADPALVRVWAESDRIVAHLAERQPSLTRAAISAKEAAAKALVRVRSVRRGAVAYRGAPASEPRFASRQA